MLFFILYKIGQFIAMALPLEAGYWIAERLGEIHCALSFKDKRAVEKNLGVILGEADPGIQEHTREVFKNFAKYLVDFFRFEKINKEYIDKYVKLEGFQNLDRAFSQGKGVIGLTAHIGNWELGGVILSTLGYPVIAVALEHKNKLVNKLFNRQRKIKGVEVVAMGAALSRCVRGLKENRMVALLGDRDFSNHSIAVNLLGKPTPIPQGPSYLSIKTGAPLIPGFLVREEKNGYLFKFIFEEPITIQPSGDDAKDIQEITSKYLGVIEKYVKAYPTQWYVFRRFWEPIR